MPKSGVYAIRCTVTGKVYIVASKHIEIRQKQHIYLPNKGERLQKKLREFL